MKKLPLIFLGIVVLAAAVTATAIVLQAVPKGCQTISACANSSGLGATLQAMPTDAPGPSPTSLPCHWEGSFCVPGIQAPPADTPGRLRPVGPGYPYDVRA